MLRNNVRSRGTSLRKNGRERAEVEEKGVNLRTRSGRQFVYSLAYGSGKKSNCDNKKYIGYIHTSYITCTVTFY